MLDVHTFDTVIVRLFTATAMRDQSDILYPSLYLLTYPDQHKRNLRNGQQFSAPVLGWSTTAVWWLNTLPHSCLVSLHGSGSSSMLVCNDT
jgi:hypothetical protein